MATKSKKTSSVITSCERVLTELKLCKALLDKEIIETEIDENHKRFVSAHKSITEAGVQINIVLSQSLRDDKK